MRRTSQRQTSDSEPREGPGVTETIRPQTQRSPAAQGGPSPFPTHLPAKVTDTHQGQQTLHSLTGTQQRQAYYANTGRLSFKHTTDDDTEIHVKHTVTLTYPLRQGVCRQTDTRRHTPNSVRPRDTSVCKRSTHNTVKIYMQESDIPRHPQ